MRRSTPASLLNRPIRSSQDRSCDAEAACAKHNQGATSRRRPEVPSFHEAEFPVHLRTVAEVMSRVAAYRPPREMRRMAESVLGWRAHYEGFLKLTAETRQEGWPFQVYPPGWSERVRHALRSFQESLDRQDYACHFPERSSSNLGQLARALEGALRDPASLQGRQVGMVRRILIDSEARWGTLGSMERAAAREQTGERDFEPARSLVLERLQTFDPEHGVEDIEAVLNPTPLPIPEPLARRVRQAWYTVPSELIRHGVVDSPNTLKNVTASWARQALEKGRAREALRAMTAMAWRVFPDAEALDLAACDTLLESFASPIKLVPDSYEATRELALITSQESRDRLYGRYYQVPGVGPGITSEQLESLIYERATKTRTGGGIPHRLQIAEQRRLLTSAGLWPLWRELQPEIDPLACADGVFQAITGERKTETKRKYQAWQRSRRIAAMWQRMVFFLSLVAEGDLARFVEQRMETCPPALRDELAGLASPNPSPLLAWVP